MVHSKAKTVTDYIAEASKERAVLLAKIRDLARSSLTDHEETMQWGMPVCEIENIRARFGPRLENDGDGAGPCPPA